MGGGGEMRKWCVSPLSDIVVFRFDDSRVEILRVLYDGMDLPGRLKPAD